MNVLSHSGARPNLKAVMDRVVDDRAPVMVTRKRGEAVVLVCLADWNAMRVTGEGLSQQPEIAQRRLHDRGDKKRE